MGLFRKYAIDRNVPGKILLCGKTMTFGQTIKQLSSGMGNPLHNASRPSSGKTTEWKMFRQLILFISLLTFLTSCADYIVESADTVFDDLPSTTPSFRARFSSIQDTVFTPTCAISGCHNGSVPPDLSPGRAYENIVNVPNSQHPDVPRIKPGEPEASYLYLKMAGGDDIVGALMPLQALPLSQQALDSIRVWILRGAPRD